MFEDYGLSSTGFTRPRLADIKKILQAEIEAKFSIKIPSDPESTWQQLIGVFAASLADTWENMERIYFAMYPQSAEGINANNAVSFSGIQRIAAEKSVLPVTCYGVNNTTLPEQTLVGSVVDSTIIFNLEDGGVITADNASYTEIKVASILPNTVYTLTINNVLYSYNSGATPTSYSILSGLSALITGSVVSDDYIKIQRSTEYPGVGIIASSNLSISRVGSPLLFTCDDFGSVDPAINTITKQITMITGYDSCSNKATAVTVGREQETDQALKLRYNRSVYRLGKSMLDSLQAHIYEDVDGVTAALVFENDTDTVDSTGRPQHSIECVVQGGANQDIANCIWKNKSGGIDTFGSVVNTVIDLQGFAHTIKFNRPTVVKVWLKITVTKNTEEEFPADTAGIITNIIYEKGLQQAIGQDVVTQKFYGPIYSGTTGIGQVAIEYATGDTTPTSYSSGNLTITDRQIAEFELSRILVVVV